MRMNFRKIVQHWLPCLFILLVCQPAYCKKDPSAKKKYFLSAVLNTDNGLPQNAITGLYFDTSSNYLWILSYKGLARYDGYSLQVQSQSLYPQLVTPGFNQLIKGPQGRLFATNEAMQVFEINRYGVNILTLPRSFRSVMEHPAIRKLSVTPYFNYVSPAFGGGKRSDQNLVKDGDGFFFYNHVSEQLFWRTKNTIALVDSTDTGLKIREACHFPTLPNEINNIIYVPDRDLFAMSTNTEGVYIYKRNSFHHLSVPAYTEHDYMVYPNSFYGKQIVGQKLIAHNGAVFDLQRMIADGKMAQQYLTNLGTVCRDGEKVFLLNESGILVYSGSSLSQHPYTPQNLRFAYFDSLSGRFWIMERDRWGYIYKGQYRSLLREKDLPNPAYMLTKGDSIFLATDKGLVYMNLANGKYSFINGSEHKRIRFLELSRDGQYCWVGTNGWGYALLDLSDFRMTYFRQDPKHFLSAVHALIPYQGSVWALTNNGIFRFDEQQLIGYHHDTTREVFYEYFNKREGLPVTEFNGGSQPIYNRWNNELILSTLNGIVLLAPSQLRGAKETPVCIDHAQTLQRPIYKTQGNWLFDTKERNIRFYISTINWDNPYSFYIQYKLDKEEDWRPYFESDGAISLEMLDPGYHVLTVRKYNWHRRTFTETRFPFYNQYHWYEYIVVRVLFAVVFVILLVLVSRLRTLQLRKKNRNLEKIVEDRTLNLKQANIQVLQYSERVMKSNNILKRANAFKINIISALVHDISVPIYSIKNITDMVFLHKENLDVSVKENTLEEVNKAAVQLIDLSDRLIKWAKTQNYLGKPCRSEFLLYNTVNDVEATLSGAMRIKKNKLENSVSSAFTVYSDPVIIQHILLNLVANANKFTTQGTIDVKAYEENEMLVIFVSDSGIGMPEETVSRLMAGVDIEGISYHPDISVPYHPEIPGSGIGYRIIFDLLSLLDGKIKIDSKIAVGTTVSVFIPVSSAL